MSIYVLNHDLGALASTIRIYCDVDPHFLESEYEVFPHQFVSNLPNLKTKERKRVSLPVALGAFG